MDGVPKHFDDLEDLLAQGELSGGVVFPGILRRLTGIIGGRIVRSDDTGQLFFHEHGEYGGNHVPLSSTASGVIPLGILALLIEKKLVDEETFLFIDEPESNLHPAWQVEMTRALLELARGGVQVVLATHSVDIVKHLEVHAKAHPEDEELLALNHFTPEGVSGVDKGFPEKLDDILIELTEPFHALRLREMRVSHS